MEIDALLPITIFAALAVDVALIWVWWRRNKEKQRASEIKDSAHESVDAMNEVADDTIREVEEPATREASSEVPIPIHVESITPSDVHPEQVESDIQEIEISSAATSAQAPIPNGDATPASSSDRSALDDGDHDVEEMRDESPRIIVRTSQIENGEDGLEPGEEDVHIQLNIKLPRHTRLRFSVEAVPADGDFGMEVSEASVVVRSDPSMSGAKVSISEEALGVGQVQKESTATGLRLWLIQAGQWFGSIPGKLQAVYSSPAADKLSTSLKTWAISTEMILFGLAILIYSIIRLIKIEDFPIYFFTDEAVQTVLAADFIRDGFRDYNDVLFPTYFENSALYNLSLSVYLQVIPTFIFGKSIAVTRVTSVLVTILGAVGVGLILKNVFKLRYWWTGILLLSMTPVWFLHSRTAFETVIMASIYTWFLYFYMLYRTKDPRYLYPSLICGGLAFYSYSPGQLIVVGTGLMLLISDARYHWENRRTSIFGFIILILMTIPYVRFQLQHPGETTFHLKTLSSYLVLDIPLIEKIARFFGNYFQAINPLYWFFPNDVDIIRHTMDGMGHILWITIPFLVAGLVICFRNIRSSIYRVILIALIAAPLGTAIVGIGVTRTLVLVIPAAILTALGLDWAANLIAKRWNKQAIAWVLFIVLALINIGILRASIVNGPTWYDQYGLYGLQYGSKQVFEEIESWLEEDHDRQIILSPTWANGTDIIKRFFIEDDHQITLRNVDAYIEEYRPLNDDVVLIMTPDEYSKAMNTPKFENVSVMKTIPYPNGDPGFYFMSLEYVDNVEGLFAAEDAERLELVSDPGVVNGHEVVVEHSKFDGGQVADLFDGDVFTLIRTDRLNPARFVIHFDEPISWNKVLVTAGSMRLRVMARVHSAEGEFFEYERALEEKLADPTMEIPFDQGPDAIIMMELEVENLDDNERGVIHVREIVLE